jgi:Protein of unknown function (DUF2867)
MVQIKQIPVPENSRIHPSLTGSDFADCYQLAVSDASLTALGVYLKAVAQTPHWVELLMRARNRIVGVFGLKDLGSLGGIDKRKATADYTVGDRVGIFTIHSLSDNEVIFADSDKHLDAKISVCKTGAGQQCCVAISTVVHIHNALGRVYMFFVVPVHRIIVPAMLKRISLA